MTTLPPNRALRWLRRILVFGINTYSVGLVNYLVLRLFLGDRHWWLALLHNFTLFYFVPLLVLLPLAFMLRARRTLLVALVLAVIGLGRVGPRFIPKAQVAPDGLGLRVLTFNMWDRNPRRDDVIAWLRQTDADLVLLQEIEANYAYNRVIPALANLYPHYVIQRDPLRYVTNITLSRYSLAEMDAPGFQPLNEPVAQRIVMDMDGQPVAVYNIHLAQTFFYRRSPLNRVVRNRYVRMLFNYNEDHRNDQITTLLAQIDNEPSPFIVAGDFNTSDQSLRYDQLAAHMRDSFLESGYGLGFSWPEGRVRNWPVDLPPLIRIDYIWHSSHFQAIRAEQGPFLGSDHLPLQATLVLVEH